MDLRKVANGLLCFAVIALLTGCTAIEEIRSTFPPINSSAKLAKNLVASPGYLSECKALNPSRPAGQPVYLGITPGQSTDEYALRELGTPIDRSSFGETDEWVYTGFNLYMEDHVVTSVDVGGPRLMAELQDLISRYGCPDLIFARDLSPDRPGGNYGLTIFIYYSTGIEFFFPDFPVSLSHIPNSIEFFKPESLESYLERHNYINETTIESKPVTWNEAVR